MKEIPLSQGMVALVDDEDFEFLNQFKWCTSKPRQTFYAVRAFRRNGIKSTIRMHRVIMGIPDDVQVDHRDGDGLNNQKCNLRQTDNQHNSKNQRVRTFPKSSKYKGVCFHKASHKWAASIKFNYEKRYLGLHITEALAALAYNKAALELFGEFASLNKVEDCRATSQASA
jgi:hypothetical protein